MENREFKERFCGWMLHGFSLRPKMLLTLELRDFRSVPKPKNTRCKLSFVRPSLVETRGIPFGNGTHITIDEATIGFSNGQKLYKLHFNPAGIIEVHAESIGIVTW
jgi:hypothetical protein